MSVPVGELRKRLMDVHHAGHLVDVAMLDRYGRAYEDGHLVMDFEDIENRLRTLRARVDAALLQCGVVVALAADDDSRYWDVARGEAA